MGLNKLDLFGFFFFRRIQILTFPKLLKALLFSPGKCFTVGVWFQAPALTMCKDFIRLHIKKPCVIHLKTADHWSDDRFDSMGVGGGGEKRGRNDKCSIWQRSF